MADYSRYRACGCSAYHSYHRPECTEHPDYDEASAARANGLVPVYSGGAQQRVEYYRCRRGCGCLVWNPQQHIQNVCTQFNQIVGQ